MSLLSRLFGAAPASPAAPAAEERITLQNCKVGDTLSPFYYAGSNPGTLRTGFVVEEITTHQTDEGKLLNDPNKIYYRVLAKNPEIGYRSFVWTPPF